MKALLLVLPILLSACATVPSKPDDNPEHIHLFTKESLGELFRSVGCSKLNFGAVPGHLFMVASC